MSSLRSSVKAIHLPNNLASQTRSRKLHFVMTNQIRELKAGQELKKRAGNLTSITFNTFAYNFHS